MLLDLKRVHMLLQTETILLLLELELTLTLSTSQSVFINNYGNTAAANADPNSVCYGLSLALCD